MHDQVDQEQSPGGAGPTNPDAFPHSHLGSAVFILIHHTDDGGLGNIVRNRHDNTHKQHEYDENAHCPEKGGQCFACDVRLWNSFSEETIQLAVEIIQSFLYTPKGGTLVTLVIFPPLRAVIASTVG